MTRDEFVSIISNSGMYYVSTNDVRILILSDSGGYYKVLEKNRVDTIVYKSMDELLAGKYFDGKSILDTLPEIIEIKKTICA